MASRSSARTSRSSGTQSVTDLPGDVAGPLRTGVGEPLALLVGGLLRVQARQVAHVVDRDREALAAPRAELVLAYTRHAAARYGAASR